MIPSLRVVHLQGCSLDNANQSLPYLNLTKLEKLDLSWNEFDHSIEHSWFWKVTSLKHLNLQYTRLFGQFPDALANMTSLQVLDLSLNSNKYLTMTGKLKNLCSLKILDLSHNDISAGVAEMMQGLPECAWTNLQVLDFSQNSLTGALPNLIGNLTSLNRLELSDNSITGGIPPGIGNLMCLTALDLSSNLFSRSVPSEIGSLTNLTSLDLSNNNFTGIVPSEIGALSDLTSLVLSKNNFSGVITEEHFRSLKGLKNIDLSSNYLKIAVDSDWVAPFRLEVALFSSCKMGPLFPAWLQWQLELTTLDISNTTLMDTIPDWFWSAFSRVIYLDISHNQISGSLPTHLYGMAFEELYLGSNRLIGPIAAFPRNIIVLDISNNALSGTLPSNLEAVQLETLLMYSNQIGGSIPDSMCKLQGLEDLDLSSNLLEGEIPQCFEALSMSYVLLSNNSLSGAFPEFLQNGSNLEFLDLAWNKFYGRIPTWIGDLAQLRFLRLSYNEFSGIIPVEITTLSYLQYLDLSGNNISGVIPLHLSNLTGMTRKGFMPISGTNVGPAGLGSLSITGQFGEILSIITKGQDLRYGGTLAYFVSIDVSGNSLTGEVPTDITSLDALINLNLSSNYLSGNIPTKIGSLQSLESLDMSKNKLSGEIPPSLSNLTSLSYLNMSYNILTGRIPSGHQLDTLNVDNPALMYIGNNGLCGPPLQKNCSENITVTHGPLTRSNQEFDPLSFDFGLMLGLVAGLWTVLCSLLFKKTWRIAYFQLFDELYDRIYVYVVVKWASFKRKTDEE
jgi:Leucine-rich repeat (LRR) protein